MTEDPLIHDPSEAEQRLLSAESNSQHALDDPETNSRLEYSSTFEKRFHEFKNPNNSKYLTTFLLLNTMIGSGILNQPYVFYASGFIGAIVGFIIAMCAMWTGLMCLTAAGIQEDVWEYSGLAHRAFQKNGEHAVDIAIIVGTFGSQIGYILVVGTTISNLLTSWGCDNSICSEVPMTILPMAFIVAPVCLYRHLGHLAILSLFSIATIVSIIFLVLIGGPIKHSVDRVDNNYTYFNLFGMIQSLGSIVFSLDCVSSNFQAFVSSEEKVQNMSTWTGITRNVIIAGGIMCMTMGAVGYLSFGDVTEGEILDNFPQAGYDVFRVMLVIHLMLYIPTNFVLMRYSWVKILSGYRSELLPTSIHVVVTFVLFFTTVLIVLALLQLGLSNGVAFSLILNITGGIAGSLDAFILPSAIYLKLMPKDAALYTAAKCLFVLGWFVMIAVESMTIVSLLL